MFRNNSSWFSQVVVTPNYIVKSFAAVALPKVGRGVDLPSRSETAWLHNAVVDSGWREMWVLRRRRHVVTVGIVEQLSGLLLRPDALDFLHPN